MQKSSRLAACFERLRAEGRAGLFPFATAGDPDLAFTHGREREVRQWRQVARGADRAL